MFFRDPVRVTPLREGLVVSPADGRVSRVVNAVPPPELGLERPAAAAHLDLHERVRLPREQEPDRRPDGAHGHKPGKFINADLDRASEDNERNSFIITGPRARVGVVQIAGLIARRIVPFVQEGKPSPPATASA